MALFVETTESTRPIGWHVGGSKLKDVVGDPAFTVSVQADGDELVLIMATIIGIRLAPTARVMTWHGEDARFIVENL